jgi:hypothetical protein
MPRGAPLDTVGACQHRLRLLASHRDKMSGFHRFGSRHHAATAAGSAAYRSLVLECLVCLDRVTSDGFVGFGATGLATGLATGDAA